MGKAGTQRGFILLLTVVLLALTGVVFAAAARQSFQRVLLAHQAQQSLQRRWAAASASGVVLPLAEKILAAKGPATATVSLSVTLGGESFRLIVGDEQAKLHALNLEAWIGRSAAEGLIREVVRECGSDAVIRLRRYEARASDAAALPALASYGQVFDQPNPDELSRSSGPAAFVTCWGDGRLNYARSSNVVLGGLATQLVGPLAAGRLLELRAEGPQKKLQDVLPLLQLDENRRQKLELLLTEESACHSVWLAQTGGRGSWHFLSVADGDPLLAGASTYSFLW